MDEATLIKHRWHPHPLLEGFWQRDGKPYVSTGEAMAIEFEEQIARERLKARGIGVDPYAAEKRKNDRTRHEEEQRFYEHESLGRRFAYEKHYVVPAVNVQERRATYRARREARERDIRERQPIIGKPIKIASE